MVQFWPILPNFQEETLKRAGLAPKPRFPTLAGMESELVPDSGQTSGAGNVAPAVRAPTPLGPAPAAVQPTEPGRTAPTPAINAPVVGTARPAVAPISATTEEAAKVEETFRVENKPQELKRTYDFDDDDLYNYQLLRSKGVSETNAILVSLKAKAERETKRGAPGSIKRTVSDIAREGAETFDMEKRGEISAPESFVRTAGLGARAIVDPALKAVGKSLSGFDDLVAGGAVKDGMEEAARIFLDSGAGKTLAGAAEKGRDALAAFAENAPRTYAVAEGLFNVSQLVPALSAGTRGARAAGEAAVSAVPKIGAAVEAAAPKIGQAVARGAEIGREAIGAAKESVVPAIRSAARAWAEKVAKSRLDDVAEYLTPNFSKKELEEEVQKAGRVVRKWPFKTVSVVPDAHDMEVARAAMGVVNKDRGILENIASVNSKIAEEAEKLKSYIAKNDIVLSDSQVKDILWKLRNVEKPIMVQSDKTLSNAFRGIVRVMEDKIKKSGGRLSDIFEARKQYDAFMEKNFPNLFEPGLSPIRVANKEIRAAVNDIVASMLPEWSVLRDSLRKQSLLYDARAGLASKAPKIGETVFTKVNDFFKKYPFPSTVGTAGALGGAIAIPQAAIPAAVAAAAIGVPFYLWKKVLSSDAVKSFIEKVLRKVGNVDPERERFMREFFSSPEIKLLPPPSGKPQSARVIGVNPIGMPTYDTIAKSVPRRPGTTRPVTREDVKLLPAPTSEYEGFMAPIPLGMSQEEVIKLSKIGLPKAKNTRNTWK